MSIKAVCLSNIYHDAHDIQVDDIYHTQKIYSWYMYSTVVEKIKIQILHQVQHLYQQ